MSDETRFTAPTDSEWTEMLARASTLGADDAAHALNHATPDDYADGLPEPDLSGEWADGTVPNDIARVAGLGYVAGAMFDMSDDEAMIYAEHLRELCEAYEEAFTVAVDAWARKHGV